MSLQRGENKGNFYQIPICFNCLKPVNLKISISSKVKENYRYIICDCGQIMKVVKINDEENLARIKRNGKEVKEAYELFFEKEYNDKIINYEKKTLMDFVKEKKELIECRKKEKRKCKLKIIR
ncbi:hypothetical protein [Clostridium sp. CCUG 7971]|uniref:hypothetical protein n=1 Tax=Clostridium sp. CCUG 7971 TaxID=2811414 RepID=UPI001ABA775A|nr:hypothetical protein [Clostridium sp. CCUG 7971]MBO3445911.1 hypothetical protein [Clostridium sp. CCUG 7971]